MGNIMTYVIKKIYNKSYRKTKHSKTIMVEI